MHIPPFVSLGQFQLKSMSSCFSNPCLPAVPWLICHSRRQCLPLSSSPLCFVFELSESNSSVKYVSHVASTYPRVQFLCHAATKRAIDACPTTSGLTSPTRSSKGTGPRTARFHVTAGARLRSDSVICSHKKKTQRLEEISPGGALR